MVEMDGLDLDSFYAVSEFAKDKTPRLPTVWMGQSCLSVGYSAAQHASKVALPDGVTIDIATSHGTVTLTGPKTVHQVIDAVLRTIRDEPLDLKYGKKEEKEMQREDSMDCSKCPRQGFCGFKRLPSEPGKPPLYRALWSDYACHTGITRYGQMVGPEFFKPEKAMNWIEGGV